jgi:hypothetical protein
LIRGKEALQLYRFGASRRRHYGHSHA